MDKELDKFKILKNPNISNLFRLAKRQNYLVNDLLLNQLEEVWKIKNPGIKYSKDLFNIFLKNYTKSGDLKKCGNWIIYPWLKVIIHLLEDELFQDLRTSRNKLLIEKSEQLKFEKFKISIAGLSVGNSIATTIRMQGGGKNLNLADNDILEISNLNRIKAGISNYGIKKTSLSRNQILEIDPYSNISIFNDGVTNKNINKFISNSKLVFDEVDDFKVKVLLRIIAKKKKVPLIMLTDNDDGVLFDYYPYNRSSNLPFFYGIDDKQINKLYKSKKIDKRDMVTISSQIVGKKNISSRMQYSLKNIGKKIYTWPQLGTAAMTAGVVGCYFARELSLGKDIRPRRGLIRINDIVSCY